MRLINTLQISAQLAIIRLFLRFSSTKLLHHRAANIYSCSPDGDV
jgi:hypothetical protein